MINLSLYLSTFQWILFSFEIVPILLKNLSFLSDRENVMRVFGNKRCGHQVATIDLRKNTTYCSLGLKKHNASERFLNGIFQSNYNGILLLVITSWKRFTRGSILNLLLSKRLSSIFFSENTTTHSRLMFFPLIFLFSSHVAHDALIISSFSFVRKICTIELFVSFWTRYAYDLRWSILIWVKEWPTIPTCYQPRLQKSNNSNHWFPWLIFDGFSDCLVSRWFFLNNLSFDCCRQQSLGYRMQITLMQCSFRNVPENCKLLILLAIRRGK